MTAGGMVQALGMRDVRANLRAAVARVEAGEALVVLRDGHPMAVLIAYSEAQHWQQVERALAAMHGLELYPELARDTAELARHMRREERPSATDVRRLAAQPRDVLAPLRTMGITDARAGLAALLDEVAAGRTMTIVSSGRFAATMIAPREFDRLRALDRTVRWFRSAGLDLAAASDEDVAAFVRGFASPQAPGAAAEVAG